MEQWLPYLCCPETGANLRLQGETLIGGARPYPVINGIPRFVDPTSYADSFGEQWRRWSRIQFEAENTGTPMEGRTTEMFERIVGDVSGVVGDIGCGAGRFIDVARRKGAKVIGLDLSSACEVSAGNFRDDPEVLIVQADALKPPLRNLDCAYSIGVLHHTPDPAGGVQAMAKAARCIAVHVYQKGLFYDRPKTRLYRGAFKLLGRDAALKYSRLVSRHVRRWPPVMWKPFVIAVPQDERWCFLDTFDAVTPTYQSAHTPDEVRAWIEAAGMEPQQIAATTWRGHCRQAQAA